MTGTGPLRAKKSLGQNFLKDPHYLQRIIEAARLSPSDHVLEIGPGLGHLTRLLEAKAARVLAIELDERLVPLLEKEFIAGGKVEIVHADALEYPYADLVGKWKVVANLPYYLSTPIIQRLITHRMIFTRLTLMLQKEVAERIAAPAGGREYGYLSVLVQTYALPRIEFMVPAAAFTPKPEVDSAVITLELPECPPVMVGDEQFFLRVVKAAFSQRRKTLRNSLKLLNAPQPVVDAAFAETGIDPVRRAESLTVRDFARLADSLRRASP